MGVRTTCLLASSTGLLQAVLVLHVLGALDATEGGYRVLFTIVAAGCHVGTRLVPRLRDRFGGSTCLLIAAGLGAASLLIIGSASTAYVAGVGMALLGIGSMVYNIAAVTLRQERTPDNLLGRVSSVFNLVGVGAIPVAALLAGSIAAATSTTWTLLVAAATCMAGLLWLVFEMGPADRPVDQGREGTHVA